MAYKIVTLAEQEYVPEFDKKNISSPFIVRWKPLNKEQWDKHTSMLRVSVEDKNQPLSEIKMMSYDPAKANKYLWDVSIIKLENVESEAKPQLHTVDTKEELDYFYYNANPALVDEIIRIVQLGSGLTEKEIKNSASAQGSLS